MGKQLGGYEAPGTPYLGLLGSTLVPLFSACIYILLTLRRKRKPSKPYSKEGGEGQAAYAGEGELHEAAAAQQAGGGPSPLCPPWYIAVWEHTRDKARSETEHNTVH